MKALPEVKKEPLFKMCGRALAHDPPPGRAENGQALVEFALLVPLLLLIFLGTVEFGRLGYIVIETSGAARAAAQYGSQNPATAADDAGMLLAAQQDAPDLTNLTVTSSMDICQCSTAPGTNITCPTSASTTPCGTARLLLFVKVNTSARYKPIYPGSTTSITITGQSIMPVGQ
jgi:Flp pilus assembly protein TadG